MTCKIFVATDAGCRVFTDAGQETLELVGRKVTTLCSDGRAGLIAVVDGVEVWRRDVRGEWSRTATCASD